MTQPYGQQPGNYGQQPGGYPQQGGYPQSPPAGFPQPGEYPQQQAGYPQSPPGGFPQAGGYPQQSFPPGPTYAPGAGGLPVAPPDHGRGGPVEKPGSVTGAAVLAFIQAGITLITTGLIFIALAAASGLASDLGVSLGGSLAEPWIVAFVQLGGLIILIFGAVQLMSGTSRNLFVGAVILQLVICVYYIIRSLSASGDSSTGAGVSIVVPLLFAIMPAIALILAMGGAATQYLQAKSGRAAY